MNRFSFNGTSKYSEAYGRKRNSGKWLRVEMDTCRIISTADSAKEATAEAIKKGYSRNTTELIRVP